MTSFDDKGASNNTWYVGAIFVLPIMLVAKCVHAYCANGQHRLWMTKVQATTDGMWVLSLRCTQQSPIARADYCLKPAWCVRTHTADFFWYVVLVFTVELVRIFVTINRTKSGLALFIVVCSWKSRCPYHPYQ